jgi:hypothetical protein
MPALADVPSFTQGREGQGLLLPPGHFVHVPVEPTSMPHATGTIEFWFRPFWSSSDLHMQVTKFSHVNQEIFRADPILVTHRVWPDNEGRVGRYNVSRLTVLLQLQKGAAAYPVRVFLRAGRWYHLAVTWHVDGHDTNVEVFINGRRKTYDDYRGGVPRSLAPAALAPPAQNVLFGSAVSMAYMPLPGQVFDEVRIWDTIRYRDDFDIAATPSGRGTPVVSLSLDGDLKAAAAGRSGEATFSKGRSLK